MKLHRYTLPSMWLVIGIMTLAANLRGPFTAVGPLLDNLCGVFGISAGQGGLLITLPLLMFCLVSPFSAPLARIMGLERALFLSLIVMSSGIVIRSLGASWTLFLGTCVLGAGIAIGNTLVPSLLKRDFPHQITKLTAVYALTMGAASALGSVVVIPMDKAFDWQIALGAFLLLPLINMVIWLPLIRRRTSVPASPVQPGDGRVWSTALAWQVSLFFGTTSFIYYVMTAWLPSMLMSFGFTSEAAGTLHGVLQLSTALPGLILAPLVKRLRDQRGIAVSLSIMVTLGALGLCWAPTLACLWVVIFGIGIGGAFILALSFVGLRASSTHQAAALSGMVQCVGYLMSATGPILLGAMHDVTACWQWPLYTSAVLSIGLALLGLGAGRATHIHAGRETAARV